jgi:PTS system mannose-specific IIA component
MTGAVVVTHGNLGGELISACHKIVGEMGPIRAISIGWDDDVDYSRGRIKKAVKEVDEGDGVLILTDMFGGTPTNISLSFLKEGKVEIVTGVNLPMLIKLVEFQKEGMGLSELAAELRDRGKKSIYVASELLSAKGS